MTTFLNVMLVGILSAVVLESSPVSAIGQEIKTENRLVAQTPVKSNAIALPIALPDLAKISLKGGASSSGRVVGIDAQAQTLQIQRGQKTGLIPLSQIQIVAFENSAIAYRKNGHPIMRGRDTRPQGKPETWSDLSLNNFRMKNPAQGQAEVKLGPPVVNSDLLRGIQSVAQDRQYVVEQIQFNPQKRTMTIQATPY